MFQILSQITFTVTRGENWNDEDIDEKTYLISTPHDNVETNWRGLRAALLFLPNYSQEKVDAIETVINDFVRKDIPNAKIVIDARNDNYVYHLYNNNVLLGSVEHFSQLMHIEF